MPPVPDTLLVDRKSTRLNSSHLGISYAVFCLKKIDRLSEMTVHTGFVRAIPFFAHCGCGQRDERNAPARAGQTPNRSRFFFTVHYRHLHIHSPHPGVSAV